MRINWIGYYHQQDGYGRFNSRLVEALQEIGHEVKALTIDHVPMPLWMQEQSGIDWNDLTISCMPPDRLQSVPGRHWLYTMTEGSVIPPQWVDAINQAELERLVVPCEHNKMAFMDSGVICPVSVVPGGTDPEEFPELDRFRPYRKPFTFMTLQDRGLRKGWEEVWQAFYLAFGGKTTGNQDVRLILKSLPQQYSIAKRLGKAEEADRRIVFDVSNPRDMYDTYAKADCVVLPSRSEGWGMPHREAACMGIPTIVQPFSGLREPGASHWGILVRDGEMRPVPKEKGVSLGEWRVVDKHALAEQMKWCYDNPVDARALGIYGALWIRFYQTWKHSAEKLISCIKEYEYAINLERPTLSVPERVAL